MKKTDMQASIVVGETPTPILPPPDSHIELHYTASRDLSMSDELFLVFFSRGEKQFKFHLTVKAAGELHDILGAMLDRERWSALS